MKYLIAICFSFTCCLTFAQNLSEYKLSNQHVFKSGDSIKTYGPFFVAEGSFLSVYTTKRFKGQLKSATNANKGRVWKEELNKYVTLEDYRNTYLGPIRDFVVFRGDTLARVKNFLGFLFIDIRKGLKTGELYHNHYINGSNFTRSGKASLVSELTKNLNDSLCIDDKLSLLWYKYGPEKYSQILANENKLKKELVTLSEKKTPTTDTIFYFSLEYKIKPENYSREKEGFKVFSKDEKHDVLSDGSLVIKDANGRVFSKAFFKFSFKEDIYIKVDEAKVVDALKAITRSHGDEKKVHIVVGFKTNYASVTRSSEEGFPPTFNIICNANHVSLWLGDKVPVFIGNND